MTELQRVQIIDDAHAPVPVLAFHDLQRRRASKKRDADAMDATLDASDRDVELSSALLQVADATDGFSGRALRKLPFQAHAFFVPVRCHSVVQCTRTELVVVLVVR